MAEAAVSLRSAVHIPRNLITVTNPATQQKIADVPVTDAAGVYAAVTEARAAQRQWAALSFAARAQALKRYRDVIIDNKDRLADVIASETGRPRLKPAPLASSLE
jgi:acyl-CoA reductase-like NAD-dependent aldehyde dehydrogenase